MPASHPAREGNNNTRAEEENTGRVAGVKLGAPPLNQRPIVTIVL